MMKSLLRNALLVLGLGAGLHGGAGATQAVYSVGGYFVDVGSMQFSAWTDAAAFAADPLFSGPLGGEFASIRNIQENADVFALINQIIAADPLAGTARFYIGLQFAGGQWGWVTGNPTFTNNLYVPSAPSSPAAIPWAGFNPYGPPDANGLSDAGAFIICTNLNNSSAGSAPCSTFGWDYEDINAQGSGYLVMQYVPAPATLGLMLAGLIGVSSFRRARS